MSAESLQQIMLVEARAEVAVADTKASILLAALGIGFAAVFAGLLAGDWDPSVLHGPSQCFWWVGAILAIASVAVAGAAIWPRYRRSKSLQELNYWGDVARFDTLSAFAAARQSSNISEEKRTEHQLWTISRLVARKYFLVRAALILGALAGIMLFFVAIATANGGQS